MTTTARLYLDPLGIRSAVEIGGQPLKNVRALTLTAGHAEVPKLTLDLALIDAEVDGEVVVQVPEKTHADLVALGWCPPVEPLTPEECERIRTDVAAHPRRDLIETIAEVTYDLDGEDGGGAGKLHHLAQARALVGALPGLRLDPTA